MQRIAIALTLTTAIAFPALAQQALPKDPVAVQLLIVAQQRNEALDRLAAVSAALAQASAELQALKASDKKE